MNLNDLTYAVIGSAIAVHRVLGPGLLEGTYEVCLQHELKLRGLKARRQVVLPIRYKNMVVEEAYRIDLLVENCLILEIKAVSDLVDVHEAQILTYLNLSELKAGLLINFHAKRLVHGLRRYLNGEGIALSPDAEGSTLPASVLSVNSVISVSDRKRASLPAVTERSSTRSPPAH